MAVKYTKISGIAKPADISYYKELAMLAGFDGTDWYAPHIDSDGNLKNRNLIWNTSSLAWEAATGSLTSGNNVTVNNFPATYVKDATLIQVRDYLDTVEGKLQTLIEQTDTVEAVLGFIQAKTDNLDITQSVSRNPTLGQGKTILYGTISQSGAGTTELVGAQGGSLKIKVVSYVFVMSLLGTIKFIGTGDLTGAMDIGTNGGAVVLGQPSSPLFETSANAALSIVTTLGAAKGHFSYFVEA